MQQAIESTVIAKDLKQYALKNILKKEINYQVYITEMGKVVLQNCRSFAATFTFFHTRSEDSQRIGQ